MLLKQLTQDDYIPVNERDISKRVTKSKLLAKVGLTDTAAISGLARAFDRQFMTMRDGETEDSITKHDCK
jgi:hypothetical protein